MQLLGEAEGGCKPKEFVVTSDYDAHCAQWNADNGRSAAQTASMGGSLSKLSSLALAAVASTSATTKVGQLSAAPPANLLTEMAVNESEGNNSLAEATSSQFIYGNAVMFNTPKPYPSDLVNTFSGAEFIGSHKRWVEDRRTGAATRKVWVFTTKLSDETKTTEIRVSKEYSEAEAKVLAQKFGNLLGRMPHFLRTGVR